MNVSNRKQIKSGIKPFENFIAFSIFGNPVVARVLKYNEPDKKYFKDINETRRNKLQNYFKSFPQLHEIH